MAPAYQTKRNMNQDLTQKISSLIAENETAKTFAVLSQHVGHRASDQLSVLESQYHRIQKGLRLNTISREEADRTINQIHVSLLDLAQEAAAPQGPIKPRPAAAATARSFDPKLLLLLLIPLAVALTYWVFGPAGAGGPPAAKPASANAGQHGEPTQKMTFVNGGLKDKTIVEMTVNGDQVSGQLIKVVGYQDREVYPFSSNTPYEENKRICMTFENDQVGYEVPTLSLDGSHCWLVGKRMDGKFGLIIPTRGKDYIVEDYYDADGNRAVRYHDYEMFLELQED